MTPRFRFRAEWPALAAIAGVFGLGWLLDRRFRLHLETLVKLNIYLMVPAFICSWAKS